MKVIEITVGPQGQTKIKTKGFVGRSCKDATREIEQALGVVESETLTAEYHQPATSQQQQKA